MKKSITEPARDIDVVHETAVVVAGSGPSGLAAAIAAGRAGARATLLERFGCFGAPSPPSTSRGSLVPPRADRRRRPRRNLVRRRPGGGARRGPPAPPGPPPSPPPRPPPPPGPPPP